MLSEFVDSLEVAVPGHLFCYFYFIALHLILCFPVNIYIFEKNLVMLVQTLNSSKREKAKVTLNKH